MSVGEAIESLGCGVAVAAGAVLEPVALVGVALGAAVLVGAVVTVRFAETVGVVS
jgi:hypothetical protein